MDKMKSSNRRMVVFYGSQTGTAEEFAGRLAKEGARYGCKVSSSFRVSANAVNGLSRAAQPLPPPPSDADIISGCSLICNVLRQKLTISKVGWPYPLYNC